MDSLDVVELVMEAESTLQVSLPNDEVARLATGRAVDLWRLVVQSRTGAELGVETRPTEDDVTWRQVRGWLALCLDLPVHAVTPELPLLPWERRAY